MAATSVTFQHLERISWGTTWKLNTVAAVKGGAAVCQLLISSGISHCCKFTSATVHKIKYTFPFVAQLFLTIWLRTIQWMSHLKKIISRKNLMLIRLKLQENKKGKIVRCDLWLYPFHGWGGWQVSKPKMKYSRNLSRDLHCVSGGNLILKLILVFIQHLLCCLHFF